MKIDFYGNSKIFLETCLTKTLAQIDIIRKYEKLKGNDDPVSYITSRIKSEESMKEKLKRKGFDVNVENALTKVFDAVGVRIICPYIDDIYKIVRILKNSNEYVVINEKDYVKNPKKNGYRSYHLILAESIEIEDIKKNIYVEIQIRTIAMDFWSSLEHEMKYKKEIKNTELIVEELKKCADIIATTDLNMQTIKNLINGK